MEEGTCNVKILGSVTLALRRLCTRKMTVLSHHSHAAGLSSEALLGYDSGCGEAMSWKFGIE